MSNSRNIADLLDTNGDVKSTALDNAIAEVSADTTPVLGGNLDTSTFTVDGRDVSVDGTKLDGIATSANNYTHPTTAGNIHLPTGGTVGQVVVNTASGNGTWQAAPGFVTGTKMVFAQAAAPTGWTQDTTNNDKALRVVSTAGGGTGGTHAFSTPPSTSHTHTGPFHNHVIPTHSHSHTLSAGAHTLSTSEMPSHNHSGTTRGGSFEGGNSGGNYFGSSSTTTGSTGGGSSHSHSLSGSITDSGSGTSGAGGNGSTSSAGPTAFAPQYVDVIVATKD